MNELTQKWIEQNLGDAVQMAWPAGSRKRTRSVRNKLEGMVGCPGPIDEQFLHELLKKRGYRYEDPPTDGQNAASIGEDNPERWVISHLTPSIVFAWGGNKEAALRHIMDSLRHRPGCPASLTPAVVSQVIHSAAKTAEVDGEDFMVGTLAKLKAWRESNEPPAAISQNIFKLEEFGHIYKIMQLVEATGMEDASRIASEMRLTVTAVKRYLRAIKELRNNKNDGQ